MPKREHTTYKGVSRAVWAMYQATRPRSHEDALVTKKRLLRCYKKGAIKRNYPWAIDDDEALFLFECDCHYCGFAAGGPKNKTGFVDFYYFNGIDLVNNSEGYVPGNVVPCCAECNAMKGSLPYDEFVQNILSAAEHICSSSLKAQRDHFSPTLTDEDIQRFFLILSEAGDISPWAFRHQPL